MKFSSFPSVTQSWIFCPFVTDFHCCHNFSAAVLFSIVISIPLCYCFNVILLVRVYPQKASVIQPELLLGQLGYCNFWGYPHMDFSKRLKVFFSHHIIYIWSHNFCTGYFSRTNTVWSVTGCLAEHSKGQLL